MKRLLGVIAGVCLAGGLASAQQPSTQAAEDEFNKGNTAYNLGKWDEAIDHFTKAYEALPQPEFLYNIAQAHRQAGNCKQATYFYKRFLSLKEHDKAAPLSAKTKADIDRFIAQLSDCAAKQESSANQKPDTTVSPPTTTTPTTTTTLTPAPPTTTTTTTTAPTTTSAKPTVATADKPDDDEDEGGAVKASTETAAPQLISLRAASGIALLSSGDLEIPVQPTFALSAGYPLIVGPLELDLGVGGSYTPLPYEVMGASKKGMMVGARAVVGAAYAVTPALALRGELGGGIVQLGGLEMGNPLVTDRSAKSFTLPNVKFGIAADYLLTPNLVATVAPVAIGYSPGNSSLYGGSLLEIDVMVGIGYRQ